MEKIFETSRYVAEESKIVCINIDKISEFATSFADDKMPHWLHNSHIDFSHLSEKDYLNFLFILHSVSFCYWGDPKWTVEYKDNSYHGAWGMVAAIMRAIDDGRPILSSEYRVEISHNEYSETLRGNVDIPLFEERLEITKEVSRSLLDNFDGDFSRLVYSAQNDALRLFDLIVGQFPSFEDFSSYNGKTIYFYKRAQLLIQDVSQYFEDKNGDGFANIDILTACADYKIPQVLQRLEILSYSDVLKKKILAKECIKHSSPEEVEIRANTIVAIEMIKQELKKHGKNLSSGTISNYVWLLGRDRNINLVPHHQTITTAY